MEQQTKKLSVERILAQTERRLRRLADASAEASNRVEGDQALAMIVAIKRMRDRLVEFEDMPLVAEQAADQKAPSRKRPRRTAASRRRPKRAA
jgi:hypothetical protein